MKTLFSFAFIFLSLFTAPAFFNVVAAPPAGFQKEVIVNSGLTNPAALAVLPDGRIVITEQAGAIRIVKNGALLPTPFATLPSIATGDRGMLGIAVDPDFATNKYVYFYYTDLNSEHKIARFAMQGDVASGAETLIWRSNQINDVNHAGGGLTFGPDGKLYVTIGDGGFEQAYEAQNLGSIFGKVLRLNKDGTIPADNPFYNTAGARKEIYALGLRNPFRLKYDPVSGNMYTGDVGLWTWEEINLVAPAANYGWHRQEGACTGTCPYTNPWYAYQHAQTGDFAIVLGPVYRGSVFPSSYQGRMFFGDYGQGFIKTVAVNPDGSAGSEEVFDAQAGVLSDITFDSAGNMYYTTIYPGELIKVTYNSGNQAPVAAGSATPLIGDEPLTVQFSSSGTYDPENQPLTYLWEFGDGTTSTEPNPTKTYTSRGLFTPKLTVSDGQLQQSIFLPNIQVGRAPEITINAPLSTYLYKGNDVINYNATATDGYGNALANASLTTEVIFHHATHNHPFLQPQAGGLGTVTIPNNNEYSTDVSYEFIFRATNQWGITSAKTVRIYPRLTSITVNTVPAGLKFKVNGVEYVSGQSVMAVTNVANSVEAFNQQSGSSSYTFSSWSDGAAAYHLVYPPEEGLILTATFTETTTTPTPTPTIALNLLLNNSFEQVNSDGEPDNWFVGGRMNVSVDATQAKSGNRSLKIAGPLPDEHYIFNNSFTLKPNTPYKLSGYIKTQNVIGNNGTPPFARLRIALFAPSGNDNMVTASITGTSDWQYVETTFTTPSDITSGRVDAHYNIPDATGAVWFDDIVLADISAPTPSPTFTPTLAPTATPTPNLPQPVVRYAFNETAGTSFANSASTNFNGTLQGTTSWTVGKQGNALTLAAGAKGVVADTGAGSLLDFGGGSTLTITGWVKASSFPSSFNTIIQKGWTDGGNANYSVQLTNTGRLNFYFYSNTWNEYRTTNAYFNDLKWHHFAVVYTFGNAASMKVYIDGVLVSGSWVTGKGSNTPVVNDNQLWIGNSKGNERFAGSLDDVRIYRQALTQQQVSAIMNNP